MEDMVANRPEISVIMLTYNREQLVSRMIGCILGQTFRDFEFIIVDNGSTDASGEIADDYAKQEQRINVLHCEKGNIGSGRNRGLDAARGKYVAFVDDDDTCKPDFLEFLYHLAEEAGADIAICGATWSNREEKCLMDAEQAMEKLLWRKYYNVAFPTKLFRRELFEENRFLETGKYDDIYLMPKMIAAAHRIAYHGRSKYHFERHDHNNSAWTQNHRLLDAETLQEYLDVYRQRTFWLSEKFPQSADKWEYFNWSFLISMVEKVTRLELTDCYEIRERLVAQLREHNDTFYHCPWISEQEKEWMNRYIRRMQEDLK